MAAAATNLDYNHSRPVVPHPAGHQQHLLLDTGLSGRYRQHRGAQSRREEPLGGRWLLRLRGSGRRRPLRAVDGLARSNPLAGRPTNPHRSTDDSRLTSRRSRSDSHLIRSYVTSEIKTDQLITYINYPLIYSDWLTYRKVVSSQKMAFLQNFVIFFRSSKHNNHFHSWHNLICQRHITAHHNTSPHENTSCSLCNCAGLRKQNLTHIE